MFWKLERFWLHQLNLSKCYFMAGFGPVGVVAQLEADFQIALNKWVLEILNLQFGGCARLYA